MDANNYLLIKFVASTTELFRVPNIYFSLRSEGRGINSRRRHRHQLLFPFARENPSVNEDRVSCEIKMSALQSANRRKIQFAPAPLWTECNGNQMEPDRLVKSPYLITHRESPRSTYATDYSNYMPRISLMPTSTAPVVRNDGTPTKNGWPPISSTSISPTTREQKPSRCVRKPEDSSGKPKSWPEGPKTRLADGSGNAFTTNIKFWKEELQAESNKLAAETGLLEELRKNLCRALAETETPMQAVQHCLLSREGRQ
ncbi:unnamed protein product, partial [Notodromas monacha]